MKRIALFNHKGGVSKTTSVYHLGWMLTTLGTVSDSSRILPNELVGQSFLSIVLKKPSDGRGRKYKVWAEFYDRIFTG
ncbi:hypothetical protein [Breoghania sp.]|uniref:ParA family protein n=1 Tax=Breoghania sp. TaxID=2065378 RepID=UPI0029C794E5|nr:hypothetical protein [Breoghania sp.]